MRFRRYAIGLALGLCFSVLSGAAVAGLEEGVVARDEGDYATAMREFRPLATQGNASAQLGLALMYNGGQGVVQDSREAAKWYRLAAAQGHAQAQFFLGAMYYVGKGVEQDFQQAAKWYRLAAAQGEANAQFGLALLYKRGLGVPYSRVATYALCNLSAANDPSSANHASEFRTDLVQTMSTKEIEAGQALTRELGKPGNLLAALDRHVKTKVAKSGR